MSACYELSIRRWVALVGPELEENLGMRYLAAALAGNGVHTEILAFNNPGDYQRILHFLLNAPNPPSVVALSFASQWKARDYLALAVALKEAGLCTHITAGGHFGTFMYENLLRDFPELDSICLYQAEEPITSLVQAIERKDDLNTVSGIAFRNREGEVVTTDPAPQVPIDALTWPDRRGEPAVCLSHRMATLVGSRGCYGSCAFCCISAWHRTYNANARYFLRNPEDVAAEMAWLYHDLGREIFTFHDDNFFLPAPSASLARICALADALERRGVGRIATVVKARPNDVTGEIVKALKDRLGLIRIFLGVETDAHQGLRTLHRGVRSSHNEAAIRILEEAEVFFCFNMLVFDPDTTMETLEENLQFMERHVHHPHNFGRVELYAGTPLLTRMHEEGRTSNDYLGYDYRLDNADIQQVYNMARRCFHARNFAAGALANRLQATRFDVESARHFHPELYDSHWLERSRTLNRRLAHDSIHHLRKICDFVKSGQTGFQRFTGETAAALREEESRIAAAATELEKEIRTATGGSCHHLRPRGEYSLSSSNPSRALSAPARAMGG